MEINDPVPQQVQPAGNDCCQHCGSAPYEDGYKVKLCSSCRRRLSRYPIKKSVLWAAIGVGLLVLLSLAKFPKAFKAGLNYERAVKLEAEHKYMSAEAALRQTLHDYPEYMQGSCHFMIAAYYNNHLAAADSALEHWGGRKFNDEKELVERVNKVLSGFQYYHFEDTAFSALRDSLLTDTAAYHAALLHYTRQHPDDKLAAYLLADTYYDAHNYLASETLCEEILEHAPDFQVVYGLLAAAYREDKAYDQAIDACNRLLRYNAESVDAHTALVKILLKQKEDKKALEKALYGYSLDPNNPGIMEALTLAYHFNRKTAPRDALLARLKQSPDTSGLANIQGIIAGTIPYRD